MRAIHILCLTAALLALLASCGGGGGAASTTPTPPPINGEGTIAGDFTRICGDYTWELAQNHLHWGEVQFNGKIELVGTTRIRIKIETDPPLIVHFDTWDVYESQGPPHFPVWLWKLKGSSPPLGEWSIYTGTQLFIYTGRYADDPLDLWVFYPSTGQIKGWWQFYGIRL